MKVKINVVIAYVFAMSVVYAILFFYEDFIAFVLKASSIGWIIIIALGFHRMYTDRVNRNTIRERYRRRHEN